MVRFERNRVQQDRPRTADWQRCVGGGAAVSRRVSEEGLRQQGKTEKRLRIRLHDGADASGLSTFLDALLERKAMAGIRSSSLITNQAGLRMSYAMLRNRWDEARDRAATKAATDGDLNLSATIRMFQFRDIRPKAASEIEDIGHASSLLGHSTQEMTRKVYRSVGEIVRPTK